MYMFLHFEIQRLNECILKMPIFRSNFLNMYFIQRQVHLYLPGILILLKLLKKLNKSKHVYLCQFH